jgi:undecaprenyl-diphosphatase
MVYLQAVALGIVQGLAEFIPISSSAHLVVVPWLFGWSDPTLLSLSFDVALHLGTLLALLAFFAKDWVALVAAWFRSIAEREIGEDLNRRMAWFLVIGSVPGGIAGILFQDALDSAFHSSPIPPLSMVLMAASIAALGLLLLLADALSPKSRSTADMTWRDAVLVGLAQAFAIFPGVSRSGATMTGALALGLDRPSAAKFSFLLSAPIVAAAGAKSLYDGMKAFGAGSLGTSDIGVFAAGLAASAVTGFFCIKYLLRFLQRHSTKAFVFYRWALAAVIVATVLIRG